MATVTETAQSTRTKPEVGEHRFVHLRTSGWEGLRGPC